MKTIRYSGTFTLMPGDTLVYQSDNSVISTYELEENQWKKLLIPELWEEQKMNYFMLDGKKIPMSEETAESLREKQKVPMVRKAVCSGEDRIIIRITNEMRQDIMNTSADTLSFDKTGYLCHWFDSKCDVAKIKIYNNIETLFEGELE